MCLSTAYSEKNGVKDFLMDKIVSIQVDGGDIILQDLLGRTMRITGVVKYVDLLSNEIICKVE